MIFKNSDRISKKTPHFTITNFNLLMLFKEIIAVYSDNHAEPVNTKYRILFIKASGTYRYHSALKG
jgi:hypothetical protein